MEVLERYLKALLLLQLNQGLENDLAMKPELLLNAAGFSNKEVAELTGKSEAAVAKAVSRARAATKKGKKMRGPDVGN